MNTVKTVTPIADAVNRRFFIAIYALVKMKQLASLNYFCNKFGLSAPRYRETRLTYGVDPRPGSKPSRYKTIETEAMYNLCNTYGISAEWLILGRGEMFAKKPPVGFGYSNKKKQSNEHQTTLSVSTR
ncbi:MAG: hypothetical protein LBT83_12110 [Tannerella sp.]|jgi:hypothetical protein|nr:hypothetical protein [Tannerella sp.]